MGDLNLGPKIRLKWERDNNNNNNKLLTTHKTCSDNEHT
jgi:hypothetical protein